MIVANWISWEKMFGSIDSINNALAYTYSEATAVANKDEASDEKKVIIKNIPSFFEANDIEQLIKDKCPLVDVKDIRLIKNENGISRQFAFVDLYTKDAAIQLINCLNNITINDNVITCALSKPPKDGANDKRTIFVNNLPYEITKAQINEMFMKYGEILDVRVIYNPKTNKPRGYCYVEFNDEESAVKCLNDVKNNPIVLLGRKIIIGQSVSVNKLRNKVEYVVHVTNLHFQLNEEELIMFFEKECNVQRNSIVKVVICRDSDKNNKSKGYGFVHFRTIDGMNEALKGNGKMLKGRSIVVKESTRGITKQQYKQGVGGNGNCEVDSGEGNEASYISEDEKVSGKKRKRSDEVSEVSEGCKEENNKVLKKEIVKKKNSYFKSLFNK
jgi:RNA recognition motif-containing protein